MKRSLILLLTGQVFLLSAGVGLVSGAGFNKKPIADVSARCRSGKVATCIEAGNRYRFGQNAPMDVLLAAEHYKIVCQGKEDYGCKSLHEIGLEFLRGKNHLGKKAAEDHRKAADFFELSCAGGYGPGCTSLGVAFRDGDGLEKDPIRATELFVLGCEEGSRRGCRLAGNEFVGSDLTRARPLYGKGCRWEDSASCAALGKIYRDGAGVAPDAKQAFDFFLQSCNRGPGSNNSEGCYSLARMYDEGKGVGKDRVEAVRLYRMACSQTRPKRAEACVRLAQAYKEGDGIAFDANGAAQFFRQACDLGSDKGCVEWHLDTCNRLGQPSSCEWLEKKGKSINK